MDDASCLNALDATLKYVAKGWPVFPCNAHKQPLLKDWPNTASIDPEQITAWWTRWPYALIGMPTGERTCIVVLDIDRKHGRNGVRTLAGLGYAELPAVPTVLTAHGGFHLHFQRPEGGLRNTAGAGGRGIGDGLDWRGDGGYVVLPAPGSGYRWGDLNYDNCPLQLPPEDLLPREVEETNPFLRHLSSACLTTGALAGALRRLRVATPGERNNLLFWTACRFAEAVDAGVLGAEGATTLLRQCGAAIGLHDREIAATIRSAFGRRT
jgi:hypothetical protein